MQSPSSVVFDLYSRPWYVENNHYLKTIIGLESTRFGTTTIFGITTVHSSSSVVFDAYSRPYYVENSNYLKTIIDLKNTRFGITTRFGTTTVQSSSSVVFGVYSRPCYVENYLKTIIGLENARTVSCHCNARAAETGADLRNLFPAPRSCGISSRRTIQLAWCA